jgi:hypothetical protein
LLKQIMKIHNKIHSHDHATIVYFLIYHYLSFSGSIENDTLCPSIWRWSWSYGSWIYYYICNQFLSPLTLWVRIPLSRYNIMW